MILRGRESFRLLFAEGRTIRSGSVLLKYRPARADEELHERPPVRTAFIVGRKYGRAVDRNRIRRLMRECWRHALPDFEENVGGLPGEIRLDIGLVWSGPPARESKGKRERICRDIRRGIARLAAELADRSTEREGS